MITTRVILIMLKVNCLQAHTTDRSSSFESCQAGTDNANKNYKCGINNELKHI